MKTALSALAYTLISAGTGIAVLSGVAFGVHLYMSRTVYVEGDCVTVTRVYEFGSDYVEYYRVLAVGNQEYNTDVSTSPSSFIRTSGVGKVYLNQFGRLTASEACSDKGI